MTTVSIIGTGKVGTALAHVFARSRVCATIANTRGPDSFPELAAERRANGPRDHCRAGCQR